MSKEEKTIGPLGLPDTTNGEKKKYTIQEILADIYARFDLFTETQTRLNFMLQGWYIKLDVYSRAMQKLAEKLDMSVDDFKALLEVCLKELNDEQEKERDSLKVEDIANKYFESEEPLIINPNTN